MVPDPRGRFSDEPTRLQNVVARVFAAQPENPLATLDNDSSVGLRDGVAAQDDCAVFQCTGPHDLVVGSDYVRGPKFRLYEAGFLDEYDLGYYLAAANFSDVAAMGAKPIGLLTVIRYPQDMDDETFESVLRGVHDACADIGAPTVGGDIGGAERLILAGTALGVCAPGGALLRRGAKPGDHLCMTGATGVAGAAMAYLRTGRTSDEIEREHRDTLLASWKRPRARVKEGVRLGESGFVSSSSDTSDGLKAAIENISAASGIGFQVDENAVPVTQEVAAVCQHLGLDLMSTIMGDSVDFELVFTVTGNCLDALSASFADAGLNFTRIGRAIAGDTVVLRGGDGETRPLPGEAWRHRPEVP
jgi:thiamine-monophosphate kinase